MSKIKLLKGHKYLYKEYPWRDIHEMDIVNITNTSIQLLYPNGVKEWISKDAVNNYNIIEDITNFSR